jgi:hypothetical protein
VGTKKHVHVASNKVDPMNILSFDDCPCTWVIFLVVSQLPLFIFFNKGVN